ncbi:MAG: hypothetical protein V4523_14250 [Pseudomonadota bacterium]
MITIERPARCGCGRNPMIRSRVVDADDVQTWVECPGCQRAGGEAIDSARNEATAIANWNVGKGRVW